jgi:hypothetical protein
MVYLAIIGALSLMITAAERPPSGGLFCSIVIGASPGMLLSKIELKAQSICNFLDAPLIANRVARGRNHCRLPSIRVVFSNTDRYFADAKHIDDHVG